MAAIKFLLAFLLVVGLPVAVILAMIFVQPREVGRWELHRQRKTCPACRDGLAVVLVDNPSRLCFTHRRRLTQIEQLEKDELS